VAESLNEVITCLDEPDSFAEYMGTIADMHKNRNVVPAHFDVSYYILVLLTLLNHHKIIL